jgi:ribonuclease HII
MPDLSMEAAAGRIVCGIDEAGRGPLAGPVVAAAVVFAGGRPPGRLCLAIDDSKKLRAGVRLELFEALQTCATIGIGQAEVEEIDRINILQATLLAMVRAVDALALRPDVALVDGISSPKLACAVRCVAGGDGLSLSIAAASIIAKVTRDRIMAELAHAFPGYGWDRNAGYGTAEHLEALARLGPTPHHRRSFRPVVNMLGR